LLEPFANLGVKKSLNDRKSYLTSETFSFLPFVNGIRIRFKFVKIIKLCKNQRQEKINIGNFIPTFYQKG